MDKRSEALFRLKPVTYRTRKEINPAQPTTYGLIAEEVAEVDPDLVMHNAKGQPESVHYQMVNVMLLNEFLKEHEKIEEQETKIARQETTIAQLKSTVAQQQKSFVEQQKQIAALISALQTVSVRIEMGNPAPKVVVHSR